MPGLKCCGVSCASASASEGPSDFRGACAGDPANFNFLLLLLNPTFLLLDLLTATNSSGRDFCFAIGPYHNPYSSPPPEKCTVLGYGPGRNTGITTGKL